MQTIDISQPLSNDNGYIDQVVGAIRALNDGSDLHANICTMGGDIFQSERICRELLRFEGKTSCTVVGAAASAAIGVMSCFDEIELDPRAEIMLHQAWVDSEKEEDITSEMIDQTKRYNQKTYARLLKRGCNQDHLQAIFLSEEPKDYWYSAKEAEEELRLGTVDNTKTDRVGESYKIAASLENIGFKSFYEKNKNENMNNLFKKAVPQVVALADGSQVLFNSKEKELKKGDKVSLVGSGEKMNGDYELKDNLVATIKDGEVEKIESMEEEGGSEPTMAEVMEAIGSLTERIAKMEDSKGSDTDEVVAESEEKLKAAIEKVEATGQDMKEKESELKASLETVIAAAKLIQTDFTPAKINNSLEAVEKTTTTKEDHVAGLREVLNNPKQN